MSIFENILEAADFALMGKGEAMATVMEREAKERARSDEGMLTLEKMAKQHEDDYQNSFFGGDDKTAVRTALQDFMYAQNALATAATAFTNPDIMGAMDAFGASPEDIQNMGAGYQAEVQRAATGLMNTLQTVTSEHNGAIGIKAGGIFTPEEKEFLLSQIGAWDPALRNGLEGANDKAGVMNQLYEKYGEDFFDYSNLESFGRSAHYNDEGEFVGYTALKEMSEQDMYEISSALSAIGANEMLQSLTSRWQGDDSYRQNAMQAYAKTIDQCAAASGAYQYNEKGEQIKVRPPDQGGKLTQVVAAGSMGKVEGGPGTLNTFQADVKGEVPVYNTQMLARCFVKHESPFAQEGFYKYDQRVAESFGISQDDILNYVRGAQAYEMMWGEDGYIEKYIKDKWEEDPNNKTGAPITGLRLKHLKNSRHLPKGLHRDDIPTGFVDLDNLWHRQWIAAEIMAAHDKGKPVEWLTGSVHSNQPIWTDKGISSFVDILSGADKDIPNPAQKMYESGFVSIEDGAWQPMWSGDGDAGKGYSMGLHTFSDALAVLENSPGEDEVTKGRRLSALYGSYDHNRGFDNATALLNRWAMPKPTEFRKGPGG